MYLTMTGSSLLHVGLALLAVVIGATVAQLGVDEKVRDYYSTPAVSTNSTDSNNGKNGVYTQTLLKLKSCLLTETCPITFLTCTACQTVATTWTGLPQEHCPEMNITLNNTLQAGTEPVVCGPFSANVTKMPRQNACKANDECHMSHLAVNDSTIDLEKIHCHHQVLPFVPGCEGWV